MRGSAWWIVGLLALAGCDGDGGGDDAGTDAAPTPMVIMTVDAATATPALEGVAAGAGFQYYVLDVTLEARGLGPISVGPNAFMLFLEGDPAAIVGNHRSGEIEDGCRSQLVQPDTSLSCRAVFLVEEAAPPPVLLRWMDADYDADADVPPLS